MRFPIAIAMLAAALLAPLAHAETVASVASPDGALKVELDLNGEGRLAYRVLREGRPLVADSRLGFLLRNDRQFLRGLKLDAQSARSFDETEVLEPGRSVTVMGISGAVALVWGGV